MKETLQTARGTGYLIPRGVLPEEVRLDHVALLFIISLEVSILLPRMAVPTSTASFLKRGGKADRWEENSKESRLAALDLTLG
jgi:hypothetical protein